METSEQAVRTPAPRQRRVGTFTLGVTLVMAGAGMLASMVCPAFRPEWLLKASPCILVLLGIETLVSCRSGGGVKYDWLGMILCFVLTGAALCLYTAAWWVVEGPGFPVYSGTWEDTGDALALRYDCFNDSRSHSMELKKGDTLDIRCGNREGWLSVEIYGGEDWETVFAQDLSGEDGALVEIPADGEYYLWIQGHRAQGHASFTRVSPSEEAMETGPGSEAGPEERELP